MPNDEINIRELLELRILSLEKKVDTAFHELDRRLNGMNELREMLNTTQARLLPRNEYEMNHRDIVTLIHQAREELAASQGSSRTWGIVAVIAASMIAAFVSWLK